MSVSIEGWVEFRNPSVPIYEDEEEWHAVVDAGWLMPINDSTSFSCLFGVRNHSGWKPIAAERGVPIDASDLVRNRATDPDFWFHSQTWVTWRELEEIDWDESVVDAFVRRYKRDEAGDYVADGGFMPPPRGKSENDTWFDGEFMYRIERITRGEAVWKSRFQLTFEMMQLLAKRFGSDNVRLVVWFQS